MTTQQTPEPKTPAAWVIESKAGIWLTTKPEIAEKNRKPGNVVTPYFSQRNQEKDA